MNYRQKIKLQILTGKVWKSLQTLGSLQDTMTLKALQFYSSLRSLELWEVQSSMSQSENLSANYRMNKVQLSA